MYEKQKVCVYAGSSGVEITEYTDLITEYTDLITEYTDLITGYQDFVKIFLSNSSVLKPPVFRRGIQNRFCIVSKKTFDF